MRVEAKNGRNHINFSERFNNAPLMRLTKLEIAAAKKKTARDLRNWYHAKCYLNRITSHELKLNNSGENGRLNGPPRRVF